MAQELLRHANSRITMGLYTQAVSADKRIASGRQIELLVGKEKSADCAQHPLTSLDILVVSELAVNPLPA